MDDPLAINFLHEKQITMFKQDITRNFYRVASNIIQIYNSYTSDQLEKVKLEGGDWAELMDAAEKLINSGIADKLELIRD